MPKRKGFELTFSAEADLWKTSQLSDFHLEYTPKYFLWPSLFKKCFGREKITYTIDDVRFVTRCWYLEHDGMFLDLFLRHPKDVEKKLKNGPLLSVSLDTGWIMFYPMDKKNMVWRFACGLIAELQNLFAKKMGKNYGKWQAID